MNKIILFSKNSIDIRKDDIETIFASLCESGFDWVVNTHFAEIIRSQTNTNIPAERIYETLTEDLAHDAIMLSYGGDGTFLEAVKFAYDYELPILGINYGHLGFLATTPKDGGYNVFEELRAGNYEIQPRSLLEISGDFKTEITHPYALNEFTIHRTEINMTYVDVFVDGDKLTTYRGDGVLISTPTGSTAYSLSAGGPIIAPVCGCFVITPIAPHNLTMRPIVIPDSSTITFRVNGRAAYSSVSIDSRSFTVPCGAEFKVLKAKKSVFLVNLQNISFYDTLRNKMMWGLDSWVSHK